MIGLEHADWPAPAGVHAMQTLRTGGIGVGPYDSLNLAAHVGDAPAAVAENRRRLAAVLALREAPRWLHQVHGARVVGLPHAQGEPEADAVWTAEPGVVCAVLTADCVPVLLCADDGSVVAAVHAGWRGLAAGVVETTIAALPVPPARLMAWLGAAIGPTAFEVGPEVRSAFVAHDADAAGCFSPGAGDRWHADLYALARRRLQAARIPAVHGGGRCTFSDARRYFSYRRDGRCGRMASLIWIAR